MNIKINKREIKILDGCGNSIGITVTRFYLYDSDSQMCLQGKYWTYALKKAKLFNRREEAETESRKQYAILNAIKSEFAT